MHRDLKPDNVRIDADGYARLIDFGTAKILKGRTFTIVGTPHYMAPEIIAEKGYSIACDMWSLGIMLYEFVCAACPFGDDFEDPYEVYHAICMDKLTFPRFYKTNDPSRPVIEMLLNKKPALRGTPESLKQHAWFADMNWEDLNFRAVEPEYKPKVNQINTSNPMTGSLLSILQYDDEQDPIRLTGTYKSPANWDADF